MIKMVDGVVSCVCVIMVKFNVCVTKMVDGVVSRVCVIMIKFNVCVTKMVDGKVSCVCVITTEAADVRTDFNKFDGCVTRRRSSVMCLLLFSLIDICCNLFIDFCYLLELFNGLLELFNGFLM